MRLPSLAPAQAQGMPAGQEADLLVPPRRYVDLQRIIYDRSERKMQHEDQAAYPEAPGLGIWIGGYACRLIGGCQGNPQYGKRKSCVVEQQPCCRQACCCWRVLHQYEIQGCQEIVPNDSAVAIQAEGQVSCCSYHSPCNQAAFNSEAVPHFVRHPDGFMMLCACLKMSYHPSMQEKRKLSSHPGKT